MKLVYICCLLVIVFLIIIINYNTSTKEKYTDTDPKANFQNFIDGTLTNQINSNMTSINQQISQQINKLPQISFHYDFWSSNVVCDGFCNGNISSINLQLKNNVSLKYQDRADNVIKLIMTINGSISFGINTNVHVCGDDNVSIPFNNDVSLQCLLTIDCKKNFQVKCKVLDIITDYDYIYSTILNIINATIKNSGAIALTEAIPVLGLIVSAFVNIVGDTNAGKSLLERNFDIHGKILSLLGSFVESILNNNNNQTIQNLINNNELIIQLITNISGVQWNMNDVFINLQDYNIICITSMEMVNLAKSLWNIQINDILNSIFLTNDDYSQCYIINPKYYNNIFSLNLPNIKCFSNLPLGVPVKLMSTTPIDFPQCSIPNLPQDKDRDSCRKLIGTYEANNSDLQQSATLVPTFQNGDYMMTVNPYPNFSINNTNGFYGVVFSTKHIGGGIWNPDNYKIGILYINGNAYGPPGTIDNIPGDETRALSIYIPLKDLASSYSLRVQWKETSGKPKIKLYIYLTEEVDAGSWE